MSVLCCHTPNFPIALLHRTAPHLKGQPLVLLGGDEQVCAVSAEAATYGIGVQMSVRQAQMRCPAVIVQLLNVAQLTTEHGAFVATLRQTGLPVEVQEHGTAYVDLRDLARDARQAQAFGADIGRQLRSALGEDLQPAIGWDCGKFTARVAAVRSAPGRMRLVAQAEEPRFLAPQPLTLLPLQSIALAQLHWLGIQTLGQFAELPAVGVVRRFGAAGKLAQRLAKGQDDRPVQHTIGTTPATLTVAFDPPTVYRDQVVVAVMTQLLPVLVRCANRLEGIRQLRVELQFEAGNKQTTDCTFLAATVLATSIRLRLLQQLHALTWSSAVSACTLTILERSEQLPQQLPLLTEESQPDSAALETVVAPLRHRYAGIFFRGQQGEVGHLVAERRSQIIPIL